MSPWTSETSDTAQHQVYCPWLAGCQEELPLITSGLDCESGAAGRSGDLCRVGGQVVKEEGSVWKIPTQTV